MRVLDQQRIDKSFMSFGQLHSESAPDDWRDRGPLERLEGLEILRQMWSDYDPDTARLPRIYQVVERERS